MKVMNEVKVENRFKLAVKRALSQPIISGQDMKAIIEFQNRDLAIEKGEPLNNFELGMLGAYAVAFN
jgi:hypothetical protein